MVGTIQERFEANFTKGDGCWNWEAYKDRDGYGRIVNAGKKRGAHRIAYQLYVGEIPDELQVLHRCDNPSCVNPAHLFLGTVADNMHDCMNKGRFTLPVHLSGGKAGGAKLTEEQVKTIREMRAAGVMQNDIAREFGVVRHTISRIVHHYSWAQT